VIRGKLFSPKFAPQSRREADSQQSTGEGGREKRGRFQFLADLLVLALLGPSHAVAHASLIGSDPAQGGRLVSSPKQITLKFDEQVTLIRFQVLNSAGSEVGNPSAARMEGRNLVLPLSRSLGDGATLGRYRWFANSGFARRHRLAFHDRRNDHFRRVGHDRERIYYRFDEVDFNLKVTIK
jgi:methionine-rich copper-binding protein CopC